MAEHLVDLDEAALEAAHAELGTVKIEDTVNRALACVAEEGNRSVTAFLDLLAAADLEVRDDAWRWSFCSTRA
jgi:hypothetical protein